MVHPCNERPFGSKKNELLLYSTAGLNLKIIMLSKKKSDKIEYLLSDACVHT